MPPTLGFMVQGLGVSLEVFFLTLLFSLPLAMPLAFGRMSKNPVIRTAVTLYLLIMRGTPLILQLIFIYFAPKYLYTFLADTFSGVITAAWFWGAAKFVLSYNRFTAVIIAFSLNYAAYFAEIYRGGIESIPKGQYEAAKVLGFTGSQTFGRIILPQVIKRILPASSYKLSSLSGVCAAGILFDKNSRSVIIVDGGNYVALGTNGNDFKNMDADLIWIGGYAGFRNVATLLFRRDSGEGYLVRINGATSYLLYNSAPLIQASATVPGTHGLMSADMIAGNYDSDYFYYAKDNHIYMTDLASLPETLQVTLPSGETVTCMQHVKYPQPSSGIVETVNYFAIATYAGGKYKVWLHELSSTGEIKPAPQPAFEGDGRVSTVTYVEQGQGNRLY